MRQVRRNSLQHAGLQQDDANDRQATLCSLKQALLGQEFYSAAIAENGWYEDAVSVFV